VLARGMPVDAMWRPEFSQGSVALLRLPLGAFGDGSEEAERGRCFWLPSPGGRSGEFHNRFVGDFVVYGASSSDSGDGDKASGQMDAARVRDGRAAQFPLTHGVGRIEAVGPDALVVGSEGRNLVFTPLELRQGLAPRLGESWTMREAQEGESRSHAFFRPDPLSPDGAIGMLGLPVARSVQQQYRRFFGSAAAMLFLNRGARSFSRARELEAQVRGTIDDACQASCVDWYGNARPIFLGDRIFALLGYELVEGTARRGSISEIGRANFAPGTRRMR
jgi:hypothetical protein